MKIKKIKLADIRPAPHNPRKVLRPGDDEWEALSLSLERFGLVEPLIVNATTGLLVSGHQRLNVLKAQGVTETTVIVVDMDADKEKRLGIALNKIDGEWEYNKLKQLFAEIDEEDVPYTGFSTRELENLFDAANCGSNLVDDDDTKTSEATSQPDYPDEPEEIRQFQVYLSFATKDAAEAWLNKRGIEAEYHGSNRNITIRMEGTEYGFEGN